MQNLDYTRFLQFRIFFSAARHLSFIKAAEELNLSPTLISKHISKLEKELGFALFERTTRYVRLTKAGTYLYTHGQPLFNGLEECCVQVYKSQEQDQKILRIGCMNTADMGKCLIPVLRSFQQAYKGIQVEVESEYMTTLIDRLLKGQYNMIVIPDFKIQAIEKRKLYWQYLALADSNVILSKHSVLAGEKAVTLEAICGESFVCMEDTPEADYTVYLKNIFSKYTKHLKIGKVYSNPYTVQGMYTESRSIVFTDAYFNYQMTDDFVRIPVTDHQSGPVIVWKEENENVAHFRSHIKI